MPTKPEVVPDRWVVVRKPYLNPLVRNGYFSMLSTMTTDSAARVTSEVVHIFGLPELKCYAAKCTESIKAEIEAMLDVSKADLCPTPISSLIKTL
jgi:hypothetical protein